MGGKKGGKGGKGGGGKQQQQQQRQHQQQHQQQQQQQRKQQQKKKGRRYGQDEEKAFEEQVGGLGGRIHIMASDGNCLFRSLADQLLGRPQNHGDVRQAVVDFMEENEADFSPFMEDDETWADYVPRMRNEGEWGGQQELVAASRLYHVNVVIHQLNASRLEIPFSATAPRTIHLSFHGAAHYNSVRALDDPCREGEAAKHFLDLTVPPSSSSSTASTTNTTTKKKAKIKQEERNEKEVSTEECAEDHAPKANAKDNVEAVVDEKKDQESEQEEEGEEEEEGKKKIGGQCPCGSGRKWRKCCRKIERQRQRLLEKKSKGGEKDNGASRKDGNDEDEATEVVKKLAAISL